MRIIPTTNSGPLTRVIGSVDFKGSGTQHVLPDVNPFVLLDEAPLISVANVPNFGLHPHSGAMILTICPQGQVENVFLGNNDDSNNNDNAITPQTELFDTAPFILGVTAGRGVVHDEHTAAGSQPTKMLQLAWMTGNDEAEAELFHQTQPVILEQDGGKVQVLLCAGTFGPATAGIACRENPSLTVLLITLGPGGTFETDQFRNQTGGNAFVYNTHYENAKGPVHVNGEHVLESQVVVDLPLKSANVKIENRATENDATVLLGFGQPLAKVWTKMLMHNGFIFASSKEAAEKKLLEYEQRGAANFGKSLN